jgi:hypothetical protein
MNDSLHTLLEVALGISLSAATGFRIFVPFLALSVAAVFGHLDFPSNLDWVETPQALIVFAIAAVLEVSGYYLPWFDHLLDTVATPAAMIAGTIVSAALAPDMDPVAQWTLALVAGGGTAGLTKGLMNLLRIGSTAISGGLTNPVLATVELLLAVGLSVLALTVPVLGVVLVIGGLSLIIQRVARFLPKVLPVTWFRKQTPVS